VKGDGRAPKSSGRKAPASSAPASCEKRPLQPMAEDGRFRLSNRISHPWPRPLEIADGKTRGFGGLSGKGRLALPGRPPEGLSLFPGTAGHRTAGFRLHPGPAAGGRFAPPPQAAGAGSAGGGGLPTASADPDRRFPPPRRGPRGPSETADLRRRRRPLRVGSPKPFPRRGLGGLGARHPPSTPSRADMIEPVKN
jgi:hypothetical protein